MEWIHVLNCVSGSTVGCTEYLASERKAAVCKIKSHALPFLRLILYLQGKSQVWFYPVLGLQILAQILVLGSSPNIQTSFFFFFQVRMFSFQSCMQNNQVWGRSFLPVLLKVLHFVCLLSTCMLHVVLTKWAGLIYIVLVSEIVVISKINYKFPKDTLSNI